MSSPREVSTGIDRTNVRLALLGILIVVGFVSLFSRLWFLQVLASDQYRHLAAENRVRKVYSERTRGRIVDDNGKVLVANRESKSITIDHSLLDRPRVKRKVLARLSSLLDVSIRDLKARLNDVTVSPYKPIPVVNDVHNNDILYIEEHQQLFPGVGYDRVPIRKYPQGDIAAPILGYTGQISADDLKSSHFKGIEPPYQAGDIVGKAGVEYSYDRYLRGTPSVRKVIVNSIGDVVGSREVSAEKPGLDVVTSIDTRIQRLSQQALATGLAAAHGSGFAAPGGGVVVMDPNTGAVKAMASYPTYNPNVFSNGLTEKEYKALGAATPDNPDDDALFFRPTQAQKNPGSTMKPITAGAAMWTGVANPYTVLGCPPSLTLPPEGGPGSVEYHDYTTADLGSMGFPESLEVSCDTFYYQLGWDMQTRYGVSGYEGVKPPGQRVVTSEWGATKTLKYLPSGSEKFQQFARLSGLGQTTGIDIPGETNGLVPDQRWCHDSYLATKNTQYPTCADGWQPGYDVNMAIGQGDLLVDPLQMAVAYAAIANGGSVMQPRITWALARPDEAGVEHNVKEFEPHIVNHLGLDSAELGVIQQGLELVTSGPSGTATSAFGGYP
ncbi:MAG: penicillin-binding transpeptidase domain-containing protein, partial [Actinomycetota bacterium]|nr:penicillin-binding transpeptidase domain-containing protein [Actinomycetota bacterium]